MLSIALVANSYQEAKSFAESKFRDKIESLNRLNSIYTLKNGDRVFLCYDKNDKDMYRGMVYDAIIVHPMYESLLDVIKQRASRP